MVNDSKYPVNIYKIETKGKINLKKIFFIILIIISIVCALITTHYIIITINQYKTFKRLWERTKRIRTTRTGKAS